jgi:hypothetical protein
MGELDNSNQPPGTLAEWDMVAVQNYLRRIAVFLDRWEPILERFLDSPVGKMALRRKGG